MPQRYQQGATAGRKLLAESLIQRQGRVLRKREGKQAILYEIITAGIVEEGISRRQR